MQFWGGGADVVSQFPASAAFLCPVFAGSQQLPLVPSFPAASGYQ